MVTTGKKLLESMLPGQRRPFRRSKPIRIACASSLIVPTMCVAMLCWTTRSSGGESSSKVRSSPVGLATAVTFFQEGKTVLSFSNASAARRFSFCFAVGLGERRSRAKPTPGHSRKWLFEGQVFRDGDRFAQVWRWSMGPSVYFGGTIKRHIAVMFAPVHAGKVFVTSELVPETIQRMQFHPYSHLVAVSEMRWSGPPRLLLSFGELLKGRLLSGPNSCWFTPSPPTLGILMAGRSHHGGTILGRQKHRSKGATPDWTHYFGAGFRPGRFNGITSLRWLRMDARESRSLTWVLWRIRLGQKAEKLPVHAGVTGLKAIGVAVVSGSRAFSTAFAAALGRKPIEPSAGNRGQQALLRKWAGLNADSFSGQPGFAQYCPENGNTKPAKI